MANLCKNCGTVLGDNAPFCPACGTPVPQGQQFPQQGQQFPQQGQQFPQQGQQFPQQGQQGQQFPQQGQQFPQQGQQFPQQGQQFPQQGQQFPQQGQQFQQQGQQFPQQGMQGPPPGAPPAKGLSKKLMIIIGAAALVVIGVVVVLIIALGGNKYESEEYFEVGGDKIPSVMNVLGEKRKISEVTISSSKSADKMVIEYSVSENQGDEMEEYAGALVDDFDFIALDEYDFGGKRGSDFQFVKVSDKDDDHIVIVTIDFNNSGYTLTIERREGELNIGDADANDDDDDDDNNGGDDDDNNGGDDDDNNGGDDDDDNNGGDDEDATPPPTDEPQGDMVEVICPAPLLGKTVEEAQGNAKPGVRVVSMSSDSKSFTLEVTEERRQELIVESRELTKGLIKAIKETIPGVVEIYFQEERFEEIKMIVNADFEKEENEDTKWQAVGALAFNGPWTQIWLGAGMNTLVDVQWFEGEDAETYWSVKSPECYFK